MAIEPEKINHLKALCDLGMQGFLMVSRDGFPLIERSYQSEESLKDHQEVENYSAVVTAIIKFANDLTKGLISDMGLHTSRLYFDFFSDYFVLIIIFDESKLLHFRLHEIQMLMKGTLSAIKDAFIIHLGEPGFDSADLILYKDKMEELSSTFDEILYDSFIQTKKIIEN
ncbi:MAG: hypothetical protein ACXAC7_01240 [Candidatus Hodarchaeales archaeon]|jgi:hypothetical protein